jgi:hypothetical protein
MAIRSRLGVTSFRQKSFHRKNSLKKMGYPSPTSSQRRKGKSFNQKAAILEILA